MENQPQPRADLIKTAHEFCSALATHTSSSDILSFFSTTPAPSIHDHGQQFTAPFIGHRYVGVDQVKIFFDLLHDEISFLSMEFPPLETEPVEQSDITTPVSNLWIVDTEQSVVNVTTTGRLMANRTKQTWDGQVHLQFKLVKERRREVEESEWKIEQIEVWGDTGAVYLARRGQLDEHLGQHLHDLQMMKGPEDGGQEDFDLGGL